MQQKELAKLQRSIDRCLDFIINGDGASRLPEEFASEADMGVALWTLSQLVRNLADKYV